jgi:hypothetical protein
MRFGGHQTFVIREGWLFKGMRILKEDPSLFGSDALQDFLGVGKNMAKAIEHWLLATELAHQEGIAGRQPILRLSPLGALVWQYDRYMLDPTSWWLLHLHLVHNDRRALTWNWFFNHFGAVRFERGTVVESLRRFLHASSVRMPSAKTLERDVACMLRTYAQALPRETGDPEDLFECPLARLGLMTMSRHSGYFRADRNPKPIPFPVFAFAAARTFSLSDDDRTIDVSLSDLGHREGAPGRVFSLSSEAIFELVTQYEAMGENRLSISNQAGDRIVRIRTQPQQDWIEEALSATAIPALQ